MSTLAQQQQLLLQALLDGPNSVAIEMLATCADDMRGRGLKAYQANAHALAQRALEGAYPVLAQLVGGDSFAELARALWHAAPPLRGDVGRWGAALADFIEGDCQLRTEPYLADVARCEWALHRCAFAADALADPQTLGLLVDEDPEALRLVLAPGTWTLSSPWPVVAVIEAHGGGGRTLAQAAGLLQAGTAEEAVVWRQGLVARLRQALPGEGALLRALQAGRSLLQSVQDAPELDFGHWLPLAVQQGLVLQVARRHGG